MIRSSSAVRPSFFAYHPYFRLHRGLAGAYLGIYADKSVSNAVAHPFALAFDGAGNGYLSSQDSNLVTGLEAPAKKKPSGVLPIAPYLAGLKKTKFLKGTIVASSVGDLPASPKHAPSDLATPQGLAVAFEVDVTKKHPQRKRVTHSVRDVLVVGNALYVADEPGDAVKIHAKGASQSTEHRQPCGAQWRQPRV